MSLASSLNTNTGGGNAAPTADSNACARPASPSRPHGPSIPKKVSFLPHHKAATSSAPSHLLSCEEVVELTAKMAEESERLLQKLQVVDVEVTMTTDEAFCLEQFDNLKSV
jgi:hypothetical protein